MTNRATDAAQWRQHVARSPDDATGWHNLAAAEGDIGRATAAELASRRAMALGLSAPETRLVLARALQSLGRLDEAATFFDEALRLRTTYADAHRDYAQLVWMRTGRVDLALMRLDDALRVAPRDANLHLIRSIVLEFAGAMRGALASAETGLERVDNDVDLLLQAAHLHAEAGDPERALALAQQAERLGAGPRASIAVCEAFLALGQLDSAERMAAALVAHFPTNQYVIALQGTVWRLLGDARYRVLYDYDNLVEAAQLEPPSGWTSLAEFLPAVATEFGALHRFDTHPFQQSVRGGGQLTLQEDDMRRPVVAALFQSLTAAVHRHLARIDNGKGPMRSRNSGRFAFSGAWSVRLSSGGSHVDHVHPQGWLSSACYLALPPTIGSGEAAGEGAAVDRAGWLRFGRPGIRTIPTLDADHFIKPIPGMLALFPAYMWHGVEPFVSGNPRLSVAFDVVPG